MKVIMEKQQRETPSKAVFFWRTWPFFYRKKKKNSKLLPRSEKSTNEKKKRERKEKKGTSTVTPFDWGAKGCDATTRGGRIWDERG